MGVPNVCGRGQFLGVTSPTSPTGVFSAHRWIGLITRVSPKHLLGEEWGQFSAPPLNLIYLGGPINC